MTASRFPASTLFPRVPALLLAVTCALASPSSAQSDTCATPTPISGLGTWSFDSSVATRGSEGQSNALCSYFGTAWIDHDVWYDWTATFNGFASLRTCSLSTLDTKLAVYECLGCPTCAPVACSDDNCGDVQSYVEFACSAGAHYLFQVGNYPGSDAGSITFAVGVVGVPLPVLHYKFEEGNLLADETGHGHTAQTQAGLPFAPGLCSSSPQFAPNNNVAEVWTPDAPDLDMTGAMTGMAWVHPYGPQSDGNPGCPEGTIFWKGGNYWFQVSANNDQVELQNEGSGNYIAHWPATPTPGYVPANTWTHLAFVRSADTRTITFYKNGIAQGTVILPTAAPLPTANSDVFALGNGGCCPYYNFCEFNGRIDEVKLYNFALGPIEITREYATVLPNEAPQAIVAQPASICAGQTVQLHALGGCGERLQWFRGACGGTPIGTGATVNVSPASTTTYYARWETPGSQCAFSSCASVTVEVCTPPVITQQPPANVYSCNGIQVYVSVGASGCSTLAYQWYKDGVAVPGATSATLSLPAAQTTATGNYNVVVSSACGSVNSSACAVLIMGPPTITQPPSSTTVCSGASASFTVAATSIPQFPIVDYRWFKIGVGFIENGGAYSGAHTATLTIFPATAAEAGQYRVWVHNECNFALGPFVTLGVTPNTAITAWPNDPTVCEGGSITLSMTAVGGSPLNVEWRDPATGSTSVRSTALSFTIDPVQLSDGGEWTIWAASPCGGQVSRHFFLNVSPSSAPTLVTATPNPVCAGTGAIQLSASGGSGPYVWYAVGCGTSPIGTGPTLTVATPDDDTRYFVRSIVGGCPASACNDVLVDVVDPPEPPTSIDVTSNPVCSGSSTTLSVVGGAGDTLRWYEGSPSSASIGSGPSITVSPASATPYFARWERLPCGLSTDATILIGVVAPNTPPTGASATPAHVCSAGIPVLLSASGGSGGDFEWFAGACDTAVIGTGPTLGVISSSMDQTYYVRRAATGCVASACIPVVLDVESTPGNDPCTNPFPIAAGTRRFDTLCAHDDVLQGAALSRTLFYSYVSPICGTLHVTLSPPSEKGVAVYADACGTSTPLAFGAGGADIDVQIGALYTLAIGDVGTTSGPGFVTLIEDQGAAAIATFSLTGSATGLPWSWRLESNDGSFSALQVNNVSGLPPSAPPSVVASAWAESINGAALAGGGCSGSTISATWSPLGILSVHFRRLHPTSDVRLFVGPAGNPSCEVPHFGNSCTFGLTGGISVYREDLPGIDCNSNGFDDVLDVLVGTSVDADQNGVPDECESNTGVPYCFGDGSDLFCPCGNNGDPGRGCANSQQPAGARLAAAGDNRVTHDAVVLQSSAMSGSTAIFFQGASQTPEVIIDDGIGCVGGPIVRLGTKMVVNATSAFPQPGDPSISVRGGVPPAGATRFYQCFYRNAAAAFCPPATSNRTNGFVITWRP